MPYCRSAVFIETLTTDSHGKAVGEVDSHLETHARWEEENKKGIVYYLRDGKLRCVLLYNVWEKVEAARALIAGNGRLQELHDLDTAKR